MIHFLSPATNLKFRPINMNENIQYYSHEASMWQQKVQYLWGRMHCLKNVRRPGTLFCLHLGSWSMMNRLCTALNDLYNCLLTWNFSLFHHKLFIFPLCQHKLPLVYSLASNKFFAILCVDTSNKILLTVLHVFLCMTWSQNYCVYMIKNAMLCMALLAFTAYAVVLVCVSQ